MATLNIKGFPDPLYEALRDLADRQHRSVAQQVTHLLSQAVGAAEKLSILELQGLGAQTWQGIQARERPRGEGRDWD